MFVSRTVALALSLCMVLVLSLASCKMAPMQVTPQPRKQVIEPPADMPRIPAPQANAAEVPRGYRVEVVVTDLTYPSSVEFDDRGNMYLAEAGYIYGDDAAPARILRVSPEGQLDVLADQLNGPITDLLWHRGRLYVSHRGKISMLEGEGRVRDLVTGLPSTGDHHNNQLCAGPDGKLYFGQGTATNSGVVGVDNFVVGWLKSHPDFHDVPARDVQLDDTPFVSLNPLMLTNSAEPMMVRTAAFQAFGRGGGGPTVRGQTKASGTILRMDPEGQNLEVYAWGLRNPFGATWGPDGRLYVSENGFDDRGSRPIENAPDNLWVVKQGAWYGWPDFASGIPVTDKRFKAKDKPAPKFLMKGHPPVEKPLLTRPPHAGVAKLDISPPGARFGREGQIFLAEVGDMAPMTGKVDHPTGFGVIRVDPISGAPEMFFRARRDALGPEHMEYTVTAGPRRPVDVRFSPDGDALYVVDVGAMSVPPAAAPMPRPFPGTGTVWRIVPDGAGQLRPPTGISVAPGKGQESTTRPQ